MTLSTMGCLALPLVEKDSSAMYGSALSRLRLFPAAAIAMSASWLGFGAGTTAGSAKIITPSAPYWGSGCSWTMKLETSLYPGLTPTHSISARTVWPVVFLAPPTRPWASPSASIRAA